MRRTLLTLILAALLTTLSGCEKIDNHRIPAVNVNVFFNTIGEWELYGVAGAGSYRTFIYQQRVPAGFPYTVSMATGYGGLLLACDPNGEYTCYDLSCPVERSPDVRIVVDTTGPIAGVARCPKCGSTYNLYGLGAPLSGEALKCRYGLERYNVFVGNTASTPYALIRR